MNARESKGMAIAKESKIIQAVGGYIVPSQSSNKNYIVHGESCTCLDHESRGMKCKHVFAVEYYLQKITTENGQVKVETKRLTYPQAWSAYNKSQETEKERFLELLYDLVQNVPEKEYVFGRPLVSEKDLLFASVLKVYTGFSLRRFMSDLRECEKKGFISKVPCFASIGHFMQRKEIIPVLQKLISLSAMPLHSVESKFAVDSSGFRTTRFNEYAKQKHGTKKHHEWLKAHICTGTKTNIIASVEITGENGGDSPQLIPLTQKIVDNGFNVLELSADKAYSSKANLEYVDELGAVPYIPFRQGTSGKLRGGKFIWRKMWLYFQYHQEQFLQHYHARSNVETTFHMIKSKFGDALKAKSRVAQVNELLSKILCHNVVVVIHETNELGIKANFV
ncbi:MAG: transposase [Candidatus Diapherotrites archaeon]